MEPITFHAQPPKDQRSALLRFFEYAHLPEPMRSVSRACWILAENMEAELPPGPEKTAGLRKLLEAKDCFVRSILPAK